MTPREELILDWAILLTLGGALLIHPALGTGVVASDGATPTGFVTARYAAGGSIAVVGASDFGPKTGAFRLLFLLNSARWSGRYVLGLRRLRHAGIHTVEYEGAGAENYVALRAEWDRYVRVLSSALNFSAV